LSGLALGRELAPSGFQLVLRQWSLALGHPRDHVLERGAPPPLGLGW
jgi:hypothetical protein